jgi:hypothetical protein
LQALFSLSFSVDLIVAASRMCNAAQLDRRFSFHLFRFLMDSNVLINDGRVKLEAPGQHKTACPIVEADVPSEDTRHLRSRFRAFNLFRGILIAGQGGAEGNFRERYRAIWMLSQRMSKCRQKREDSVPALYLEAVF